MNMSYVSDTVIYTVISKLKSIGAGNTFNRDLLIGMGIDRGDSTTVLNILSRLGLVEMTDDTERVKAHIGTKALRLYLVTDAIATTFTGVLPEDRKVYEPYAYFEALGVGGTFCRTQMVASIHNGFDRTVKASLQHLIDAGYIVQVGSERGIMSGHPHRMYRVLKTGYPDKSPFNPKNLDKHRRILARYGTGESEIDGGTEEEPAP